MSRTLHLCAAAAALTLLPMSALAGGWAGGVPCEELAKAGQLHAGATCTRGAGVYSVDTAHEGTVVNGVLVQQQGFFYRLIRHRPATEVVNGRRCPYPHRPSDSVFSGGSAYIIKDTVRARIGCVY